MVQVSGVKDDGDPRRNARGAEYGCPDHPSDFEQATVRYKCYPIEPARVKIGYWVADAAIQFIVGMILIGLLCVGYVVLSGAFGGI